MDQDDVGIPRTQGRQGRGHRGLPGGSTRNGPPSLGEQGGAARLPSRGRHDDHHAHLGQGPDGLDRVRQERPPVQLGEGLGDVLTEALATAGGEQDGRGVHRSPSRAKTMRPDDVCRTFVTVTPTSEPIRSLAWSTTTMVPSSRKPTACP